jgi:hypothetical protein
LWEVVEHGLGCSSTESEDFFGVILAPSAAASSASVAVRYNIILIVKRTTINSRMFKEFQVLKRTHNIRETQIL